MNELENYILLLMNIHRVVKMLRAQMYTSYHPVHCSLAGCPRPFSKLLLLKTWRLGPQNRILSMSKQLSDLSRKVTASLVLL